MHRTNYNVLKVRNECRWNCFENYKQKNQSLSACDGGCGYISPACHSFLLDENSKDINIDIARISDKKVWLYVLDFFDEMNSDIFESIKENNNYLTVEGCVASFYKNYLDKIQELKNKGIKEVWFGVESGNENLRNSYNKPYFNNEQLHQITHMLKDNGIKVCWYLVQGPEDTVDSVLDTNKLIDFCKPDTVWFSLLRN